MRKIARKPLWKGKISSKKPLMQKLAGVMRREKQARATWKMLYNRQKLDKIQRDLNAVRAGTGAEQRRQVAGNKWKHVVDRYSGGIVPGSSRHEVLKKLSKLQAAVRGAQYRAKNKPPMRKRLVNKKYPRGRVYNARRNIVRARSRTNFSYS